MLADRRLEASEEALAELLAELRQKCPNGAGVEAAFVHKLLSVQMRHHAYAVIRHVIDQKLGEGGHRLGVADSDRPGTATSPSPNSDVRGHRDCAAAGPISRALPSEPDTAMPDEGGQIARAASRGQIVFAPSSGAERGGEGHEACASNGHGAHASPPRPKPKAMDPKFREALLREKQETSRTILFALHDGRDIMKVKMRELPAYRALGARQAAICNRIIYHAANARPEQDVGEVISEATLRKFVAEAERGLRHVGV